jgi:hypothetical protein
MTGLGDTCCPRYKLQVLHHVAVPELMQPFKAPRKCSRLAAKAF